MGLVCICRITQKKIKDHLNLKVDVQWQGMIQTLLGSEVSSLHCGLDVTIQDINHREYQKQRGRDSDATVTITLHRLKAMSLRLCYQMFLNLLFTALLFSLWAMPKTRFAEIRHWLLFVHSLFMILALLARLCDWYYHMINYATVRRKYPSFSKVFQAVSK